jgi:hypothetical protein
VRSSEGPLGSDVAERPDAELVKTEVVAVPASVGEGVCGSVFSPDPSPARGSIGSTGIGTCSEYRATKVWCLTKEDTAPLSSLARAIRLPPDHPVRELRAVSSSPVTRRRGSAASNAARRTRSEGGANVTPGVVEKKDEFPRRRLSVAAKSSSHGGSNTGGEGSTARAGRGDTRPRKENVRRRGDGSSGAAIGSIGVPMGVVDAGGRRSRELPREEGMPSGNESTARANKSSFFFVM